MWIPVLELNKLRSKPVRVVYWGTPVVLFRTENGTIGALLDRCAHRSVPLSLGSISGETIKCGYHGFSFDVNGRCASIPKIMGASADLQRACTVQRFHCREAIGLIWISVDPEATFPIDNGAHPWVSRPEFCKVNGPIMAWLDHFLDGMHIAYVHLTSIAGGTSIENLDFEGLGAMDRHDSYPVMSAGHMLIHYPSEPRLQVCLIQARTVSRFLKQWVSGARRQPAEFEIQGAIFSPATQRLRLRISSGFGDFAFYLLAILNPIRPGLNELVLVSVGLDDGGWLFRKTAAHGAYKLGRVNILDEDAPFLGQVDHTDSREFHLTRLDQNLVAMRGMFARYLREKSHLYPSDSLIHQIGRGSGLEVDAEIASVPVRVLRERLGG